MPFGIETFLRDLTRLPHRGASTAHEKAAIEILTNTLREQRASVTIEPFRTPKTYVSVIYWLTGAFLLGLLAFPYLKTFSVILTWLATAASWLFFNWRYSPITSLPPLHTSHNIIGRWFDEPEGEKPAFKVILMAHYDTAPVSLLYRAGTLANFRAALVITLGLMLIASVVVFINLFTADSALLFSVRYILAGYFILQAALSTLGYWLYGYSNGASDNATGVAAAISTAERLRQTSLPGLDIEVVLTGAEETGLIGSRYYLEKHIDKWPRDRTAVINFDTLGNGELTLIRQTGTVETIRYENTLYEQAEKLRQERQFSNRIKVGDWHTSGFDSVWFVREGIPVITLSALDDNGQMPNIHRKEDKLLNTTFKALTPAVDFAAQTLIRQYQALGTVNA